MHVLDPTPSYLDETDMKGARGQLGVGSSVVYVDCPIGEAQDCLNLVLRVSFRAPGKVDWEVTDLVGKIALDLK